MHGGPVAVALQPVVPRSVQMPLAIRAPESAPLRLWVDSPSLYYAKESDLVHTLQYISPGFPLQATKNVS
ncbi:MAG: hypothetical protein A2672_02790 [Candidatus Wildermuthbacteria bacterium RIFCSPHIGHO2_01_FULL_49_22b]|uniref:Uncharacterized protein n=1 Tax=Candidatus Wildermuthbacteria bacterium RIFCSPHIGHO2_01_FULL_49_22b TaxID=1802448 RepID=A0A1G2QXN9_9BACT|nr:MAG: hypothetical protein A2672_02790 [Candidatus Wildermuthbacteria bacterium RIFCSPHIGHO2_01_FULL_49_22b]